MNADQIIAQAEEAGLQYTNEEKTKGFSRQQHGSGFTYLDLDGIRISADRTVDRIEALSIPPAWTNVWINPSSHGHLQATGFDEKGRKQYIYHEEWTKICQQNKFNKVVFFGEVLPHIRRAVESDMAIRGHDRKKVTATVVWLLEHTFIRIGNKEYAKENSSYGLTTMRHKHVNVHGDTVQFEFKGKSGKKHQVDVTHPKVARTIRQCIELPGYQLFEYIDDDQNIRVIESRDINEYLQTITGEEVTAKDFRTWGATVISADTLHDLGPFTTKTEAKKNITRAVKNVSQHLGNTPKVCRSYYIHPTIPETYQKKILVRHFEESHKTIDKKPRKLTVSEYAVVTLLKKYPLEG